MAYKSILTYLDNSESCKKWTQYAVDLAVEHDARLLGLAPREIASSLYVGDFMSANSMWLTSLQERIDADAKEAVTTFNKLCEERGLKSAESQTIDGSAIDVIRRESLFTDLIVLGQYLPGADTPTGVAGMVESLLMTTGRPVLIVPALGQYKPGADNVLVAWRESKESSFALRQSLPLLSRASSVELVEVSEKADSKSDATRSQIVSYLELHGIAARQNRIISSGDVGNMLLSHACDAGTELMVMGGYGHARIKEWALGGVTKTILDTMTVPVLMAH